MARIKWTRRLRSILASCADLVGDWFYYFYVRDLISDADRGEVLDEWVEPTVFGIVVASSFFSALAIAVIGFDLHECMGCKQLCGISAQNWANFGELFFEDIPQVGLTAYIAYEVGRGLTPLAVFNLTTSGINFILDVLDVFEGWDNDVQQLGAGTNSGQTINGDTDVRYRPEDGAFPVPY
jgi:hypothetical protein